MVFKNTKNKDIDQLNALIESEMKQVKIHDISEKVKKIRCEKIGIEIFEDDLYKETLKIRKIKAHDIWVLEGSEHPNKKCKDLSIKVVLYLYEKYNIKPISILPSIENGIYIRYYFDFLNAEIEIETYNDLTMSGVSCINKEIVCSDDVKNFDFENLINSIFER